MPALAGKGALARQATSAVPTNRAKIREALRASNATGTVRTRSPGRVGTARAHPRAQRSRPSRPGVRHDDRSEEHTSELQSRLHLVCRLLLEKKKINTH